mgnify:CR=1 FL=1
MLAMCNYFLDGGSMYFVLRVAVKSSNEDRRKILIVIRVRYGCLRLEFALMSFRRTN